MFTLEQGDVVMTGTPKGVGVLVRGDVFCGTVYNGNALWVEATGQVE